MSGGASFTILLYIRCNNLFPIPKTLIFIRGHIKYLFCEFYSHDSKTKAFCYHWKASHLTLLWNRRSKQFGNGVFMNFFYSLVPKGILFKNPVVLPFPSRPSVAHLQWGPKVLRHLRKMASFCIVDIPIPFPCLPQPLPPKINVVFWTLKSFFYFRQHWFGGWGGGVRGFTAFERNEIIKELNVW